MNEHRTVAGMREVVDLIVTGDVVLTMDREPSADAAVVVRGDRIIDVLDAAEARAKYHATETIGGAGTVVMPGLINAHQHLTGDRLVRSTIPDDLGLDRALNEWALPSHEAHTADMDEMSATLALVEAATNGITYTVEAGTVAHPDRVLAAFDAVGVGGTLGSWGWDVDGGVHAGAVSEVIDRQRTVAQLTADHPRVDGWVTLVGHDLMSDELISSASALARDLDSQLTFHMSPSSADTAAYHARTGRSPLVYLDELGALGSHVLIAHAVHIDDDEVEALVRNDVAVASCPWAYLRLGQGVSGAFRHPELIRRGGRVALGCDSENAGDAVDVLLAARLFAGLVKDTAADPAAFGAQAALRLATIDGARAIGMGAELGSITPGKRADIVVVDTTGPTWTPHADDPTVALVWASDGRAVRDVVAAGTVVVRDGSATQIDVASLAAEAQEMHRRLVGSSGAHSRNQ